MKEIALDARYSKQANIETHSEMLSHAHRYAYKSTALAMASNILRTNSAPHFALQFSAPVRVEVGGGDDIRTYFVPEGALHMHTAYFRSYLGSTYDGVIRLFQLTTPAPFEVYLFWVYNGKLPEVTFVQLQPSNQFDVESSSDSDEGQEDQKTDEKDLDEELQYADESVSDDEDEEKEMGNSNMEGHEAAKGVPFSRSTRKPAIIPLEPLPSEPDRSILADWLDAYDFASRLGIDALCNAIMERMCCLAWENKRKAKTITDAEAELYHRKGGLQIRHFIHEVVFLNLKFFFHPKGLKKFDDEGVFEMASWGNEDEPGLKKGWTKMLQRMERRTRIEVWIRGRDRTVVEELFILPCVG